MVEDELGEKLGSIGDRLDLTAYEIEAYLTILQSGSITASALADRTSIPQPRVYDTVRSLSHRGLVELHESRPMTVMALDPTDAVGELADALFEVVDLLHERYTSPTPEASAVSLVKSRSTILRHLEDVIVRSSFDLALSLSPELLVRFQEVLKDARARGVSIELLISPSSEAPEPDRFAYSEVATEVRVRRGVTTPILAVGDGSYSVYATQEALSDREERYGVIFNRSELGFLVFGFFGTVLWTTADVLEAPEAEISFPRRYASIRRCIKDIQSIETQLYARIDGRWVESGHPCSLTGNIQRLSIAETGEIASMTVLSDESTVTVGGRLAALEDIEAYEILVSTDPL